MSDCRVPMTSYYTEKYPPRCICETCWHGVKCGCSIYCNLESNYERATMKTVGRLSCDQYIHDDHYYCPKPDVEHSEVYKKIYKPAHYTQGGIECIEAIKAMTSHMDDGFKAYCLGNVLKYIWRHEDKDDIEDLLKAENYLTYAIQRETEIVKELEEIEEE